MFGKHDNFCFTGIQYQLPEKFYSLTCEIDIPLMHAKTVILYVVDYITTAVCLV